MRSTPAAFRAAARLRACARRHGLCLALGLAGATALPCASWAQATPANADCMAGSRQRLAVLQQAVAAARKGRSSLKLMLGLKPVEGRLAVLQAALQGAGGNGIDCERLGLQIDAERENLQRLIPGELEAATANPAPMPAAAPAPASMVAMPAPMPPSPQPAALQDSACAADNEQRRSDFVQRFTLFMQTARVAPDGLGAHQALGQGITQLDAAMTARPDDCATHAAALERADAELQRLVDLESRAPDAPGGGPDALVGTMPMPASSNPRVAACTSQLRVGLRDLQQDAFGLMLATSGDRARALALLNRILMQQVSMFSRGQLSPEACSQLTGGFYDLQRQSRELNAAYAQMTGRPVTTTAQAAPRPVAMAQAPSPGVPAPPGADPQQGLLECQTRNRSDFGEFEREARAAESSGRFDARQVQQLRGDVNGMRSLMNRSVLPIQCVQMSQYIAIARHNLQTAATAPMRVAAAPPPATAQNRPQTAAQAPAPSAVPAPAPAPQRMAAAMPPPPPPAPMPAPAAPPPPAAPKPDPQLEKCRSDVHHAYDDALKVVDSALKAKNLPLPKRGELQGAQGRLKGLSGSVQNGLGSLPQCQAVGGQIAQERGHIH